VVNLYCCYADGCWFDSVWSAQGNAALWLQQISVIDFEVDIVAEQKHWSKFVCLLVKICLFL